MNLIGFFRSRLFHFGLAVLVILSDFFHDQAFLTQAETNFPLLNYIVTAGRPCNYNTRIGIFLSNAC